MEKLKQITEEQANHLKTLANSVKFEKFLDHRQQMENKTLYFPDLDNPLEHKVYQADDPQLRAIVRGIGAGAFSEARSKGLTKEAVEVFNEAKGKSPTAKTLGEE